MGEECCPRFNPGPWNEKTFAWKNKKFVKESVWTFFYIPINFGGVMERVQKKIDAAGAKCVDWMGLSDHKSKWKMDVYVAVDKEVPGAENITLSGKFLSKVYGGDFKKTGEWCKDFEEYAKTKGLKIKKMYMWYTTCPKCAKKYGENYVVILAEVE